jgi:hypothetical protein
MSTPNLQDIDTPAVHSLVRAYLMARTYAECQRERVDAIHFEILTECPIYADKDDGQAITKSGDLYLTSDDQACKDFYAEANARLRHAGIKPTEMADEFCPALVAEHLLRKTERILIDESGKAFGVSADGLLGTSKGLENWQKWLDLVCKLIVNLPNFETPKLRA